MAIQIKEYVGDGNIKNISEAKNAKPAAKKSKAKSKKKDEKK